MGVAASTERDLLRICLARLGIHFFETRDLVGLGALCSLDNIELNLITLFEALIALALNGTVMNEDVSPTVPAQEAVAFCVIEPLYGALVLCQWSDSP
jgi:hypothetical protein